MIFREVVVNYWERNLEMIETFRFVRLDEGEMRKNIVWKWRKCLGKVKKVMETGIRFENNMEKDRESLSRLSLSEFKLATTDLLSSSALLPICVCHLVNIQHSPVGQLQQARLALIAKLQRRGAHFYLFLLKYYCTTVLYCLVVFLICSIKLCITVVIICIEN